MSANKNMSFVATSPRLLIKIGTGRADPKATGLPGE
jgi:hypothetical protein